MVSNHLPEERFSGIYQPTLHSWTRRESVTTSAFSKMFGALNRFISRLDSDGPSPNPRDRHGTSGFQVLRNKNSEIPLEPWYDIVIGINGRQVVRSDYSNILLITDIFQDDPNPNLFATEIRNCAGSNVALSIWSAKVGRYFHNPPVLQLYLIVYRDNVYERSTSPFQPPLPLLASPFNGRPCLRPRMSGTFLM